MAQNILFSGLYYAMAQFSVHYGSDPMNQFTAIFAIFFGSQAAANAQQFGPDAGKAKTAGTKIFNCIDIPTKTMINDKKRIMGPKKMPKCIGKIEFRDVWFRYPTR